MKLHRSVALILVLGTFTHGLFAQLLDGNGNSSIAVCSGGTVEGWGSGCHGELGLGFLAGMHAPTPMVGLTDVVSISGGQGHSLMVKSDGTLWATGFNAKGGLGINSTTDAHAPVQVSGLTGVIAAAAGNGHSLALKDDGTVWASGWGSAGQLGRGILFNTGCHCDSVPAQVINLGGVVAIAAGWSHALALKNDGTVWGWGSNSEGQVGDGTWYHKYQPVQVIGLTDVVAIGAGTNHSLAVKADGSVWTWGQNAFGELGDGTTTHHNSPAQVPGLTDAVSVAGGFGHSLVLKSDGTVWAFGQNDQGQLGDNTNVDRTSPVMVTNAPPAITAVACGGSHSLASTASGLVWSWGRNTDHEMWDGTTIDRWEPVPIPDACAMSTAAPEVAPGRRFSLVPNPTSGYMHIEGSDAVDEVWIRDALGQVVWHANRIEPNATIDLSGQPDGIYLVKTRSGSVMHTLRAVKQ